MPTVASAKELARTFEREVGRAAILKRRWVCVLTDDALQSGGPTFNDIVTATTGGSFGVAHPDPALSSWKLRKVYHTEGFDADPYKVEVVAEYGTVRDEEILAPVNRPTLFDNFEAQPIEIPALFYYDGSGNGAKRPLTNSANDYFPGLVTQETAVRFQIKKNFATFPGAWTQANNFVNDATYFGCAQYTLLVAGVSVVFAYEESGGTMAKYWTAIANIVYRESTHVMQLPDVGWNYLEGGQKRRAMVFDFQNGEWVASPNPVGLDGNGMQTLGVPAVLQRRVNPSTDFQALFGNPPT